MKCELCHKANAETAIKRVQSSGSEEELYVCKSCAKAERLRHQKKSQRTRKISGLPPGMEMSITELSGDGSAPPPFLEAIMDAVSGMVSDMAKKEECAVEKKPEMKDFPLNRVDADYRIGDAVHLEGLHLIGDLESVIRAMHALELDLVGVDADGVKSTGHVYHLQYSGPIERVRRIVEALLREERNARVRLFEELPRVFGDSLCRALAILKNCRLLSPGELFDLLSPLRLAARENMLDGIDLKEIESIVATVDLASTEDTLTQDERDRLDAERADSMNRRFEDVVLNELAEEKFL